MSIAMTSAAVAQGGLGLCLVLFGWWGASKVDDLIPSWVSEEERLARRRSYLFGARGCQFVGFVLLIFAAATAVATLAGIEPTLRPQ